MAIPLQITFRDIEPSPAIENRIRERAEKLERMGARITSCHVVVSEPHRHQRKGEAINVRIDLKVPGQEIVVNREPAAEPVHADVYVAIRDAFDAARRQLEDSLRRRRGDVKTHEPPSAGRVVRLDLAEGWGFLETPDGLEVYFHRNAVTNGGFVDLTVGAEVRFTLSQGEEGPQASTVDPVGKHHVMPSPP